MSEGCWLDVTRTLYPGMPTWPGDHPVEEAPSSRILNGGESNVSAFTFSSHAGTHVDPPLHFEPGAPGVDALDLAVLCGPCRVVDLSDVDGAIQREALEGLGAAGEPRLLLRTRNSDADPGVFHEDFVALSESSARWLVENGTRLVGIDGPSIEPYGAEAFDVHHTLLRAGVVIVEGLDLSEVQPGPYEMVCAPIKWRDGDGAPARVLLRAL